MTITSQEAEEKRKQLLAKELTIKRNLSLVKFISLNVRREDESMLLHFKALRDNAELFVDATEFCAQLDWFFC